jgi:pimeloyl-ACP methyl ester carboxylesterase
MAACAAAAPALAGSTCLPDRLQESGAIYRICMPPPESYNGRVFLYTHGFQDAGTPVQIPESQLTFDDVVLPELINSLGFGFAMSSYSKTGLAVQQGVADTLDLLDLYAAEQGEPEKVYVAGVSEGGLITALLVERHPERIDGGVAACGPVGDFRYQINYFGDGRALFEYFFPGLIPGDPFAPSAELVEGWSELYESEIRPVILAEENRDRLEEWVRVAKLPFDEDDWLGSVELSARDVLRYAVVNFNDAVATLGGMPYGNRWRYYRGSSDDRALNLAVIRTDADPAALHEMDDRYDTSGVLRKPLMTLHTRLDQQVPYFHETIYNLKTLFAGSLLTRHLNFPVDRYEHCLFTVDEALLSFGAMLLYAGDVALIPQLLDLLPEPERRQLQTLALEPSPWNVGTAAPERPRGDLPKARTAGRLP